MLPVLVVILAFRLVTCGGGVYETEEFCRVVEASPDDFAPIEDYVLKNRHSLIADPDKGEAFPDYRSEEASVARIIMLYDLVDCGQLTSSQIRNLVWFIGCKLFPKLSDEPGVPVTPRELQALFIYATDDEYDLDTARLFEDALSIPSPLAGDICSHDIKAEAAAT
ncbi:EF-hand domain-containing protein [Plasmodiophora brassicae]|uniref:EF-hand domain-containing protein n=1 Tax=Plasmodiophora brassicae TaxID=37360 RepID=A0A0G4IWR2_PLABS|nr:hypothetical protein PBRA_007474 [Plasmodiophora brassicae]SPQ97096.1 unnamed protein product [Plasmodiophora brassicae]